MLKHYTHSNLTFSSETAVIKIHFAVKKNLTIYQQKICEALVSKQAHRKRKLPKKKDAIWGVSKENLESTLGV